MSAASPDLDVASSELVIAAPGSGPGFWAGGPSVALGDDAIYLAYRLRRPVSEGRGYANVVARSTDGVAFETIAVVHRDEMVCASLERPALVRRPDGGWRLFVSLSTPRSKHWWIEALDADEPEDLSPDSRFVAWPGDESTAVKDPVVLVDAQGVWHAWVCCHPLDVAGEEDRMVSRYARSENGVDWTWGDVVLSPDAGGWDRRGRRVTSIVPRSDGSVVGYYDGRADSAENWYERTGLLHGSSVGGALAVSDPAVALGSPHDGRTLRYVSMIDLGDGTGRAYFEAAAADGSNEIRTQVVSLSTVR